MKKRRRLIVGVAAVVLAIVICIALKREDASVEIETATVSRRDVTESIPASGKIQPVIEIKISPEVSGEIVKINCQEGERVSKGEILIQIKPDLYQSMVEKAEASLNSLRSQYLQQSAQMLLSESKSSRDSSLFRQDAISRIEFDESVTARMVAQEQLRAAEFAVLSGEASLKEARENLAKTTLYSPMSGIISRLSVEEGERVVGTSQMAGTELMRIADMGRMELVIGVGEHDITRISRGDTASIKLESYSGREFTGIVTRIANSAKNIDGGINQVTTFEVRIEIAPDSYDDLASNGNIPLKPGMSATASVMTSKKSNVLTIPVKSIFSRDGLEYVWIVSEDGTALSREISTGIQDFETIEITGGLDEGDVIISGPYSAVNKSITEGLKVIGTK